MMCQNMVDFLSHLPESKPEQIELAGLLARLGKSSPVLIEAVGASHLYTDPVLLERLLLNLARNARQAGASTLFIDIWQAGSYAVLDIADNGKGVADDMQPFLFKAFHSGHRGGSGLGLAIVKDMAVAMGGDIKLVRSSASGTVFRLQLPDRALGQVAPANSPAAPLPDRPAIG